MDQERKSIEFTREQFLALMKTVYLGNWMANSCLIGDDKNDDCESTEDLIFSLAPKFGLERCVDHEPKDGDRFFPTRHFEEEAGVGDMIAEYDAETFWDEVTDRLGERDFLKEHGESTIQQMSPDEQFDKLSECIDKWGEEFEEHGLERISIK